MLCWKAFFVLSLRMWIKKHTKISFRMETDDLCSRSFHRVCTPCRSLVGGRLLISWARVMKRYAVLDQFFRQCVVSVTRLWLLIGVAVWLSSNVWMSASHLVFVRHQWSLLSSLMAVSSLFVVCSCGRL